MKKLIFAMALAAITTSVASAQDTTSVLLEDNRQMGAVDQDRYAYEAEQNAAREKRSWSKTSYVNFGYTYDQKYKYVDEGIEFKSKWGFSFQAGNSFQLPRHAIADYVKIGIDATWFDLSATRYDTPEYNGEIPGDFDFSDLGSIGDWATKNDMYQVTAGMGIGLSLHVAPFTHLGAGAQPLRVQGFCRFVPSYSAIVAKIDDDTEVSGAFCPIMSYGFGIDYRAIGVGMEFRSGEAKYKNFIDDSDYDAKRKGKFTSGRVYLSIHF